MVKIKVKNIAKDRRKKIKKIKNFWKKVGQIRYLQIGVTHPYSTGNIVYKTLIFNVLRIILRFTDFEKIDRFAHKTH